MKTIKKSGYEISPVNPGWIRRRVPESYADDLLKEILLFYVINTPCADLSSSSIPLLDYGWPRDVWKNDKCRLKNMLLSVANLERGISFIPVKHTNEMKEGLTKGAMMRGFAQDRRKEKIVFYKPSRYNEFMAVFYHIRNSFAHGRLAMYPIENTDDIMFVLEDGIKFVGKFQVRSRLILKKSTLLKWIDIIKYGFNK